MKKTILTLSALCAGAACAQSSVTLFGVVDTNFAHGAGSIANRSQISNSGNMTSRFGLRGTEDLGGGLSGSFWLEAGVNTDNGSGSATNTNNQTTGSSAGQSGFTFNRRSTVSLAGGFGELRLGRDYTAHFWNTAIFDPFDTVGVGTSHVLNVGQGGIPSPNGVRSSNAVSYLTPSGLNGFHGQLQTYLGENASNAANSRDGRGVSARAGWDGGPARIAVGTGQTRYLTGDVRVTSVGGSWQFDAVRVMGMLYRDRVNSAVAVTGKGFQLGFVAPVGVGQVKASYARYETNAAGSPTSSKLTLGYVHNLSKRTALYATFAHLNNSGGASFALNGATTAANNSSKGYDIGLRHAF